MSNHLRLTLLGVPQVALNGAPITGFVSSKAPALLYYLVVTGRPHARQLLSTLLWGNLPDTDARANLRVVLSNLRQLLPNYLTVTRETVAFNHQLPYWLDVAELQRDYQLLAAGNMEHDDVVHRVVALHQGDFLEGLSVRDALEFEEWMILQREQFHQVLIQTFHILVDHLTEQGLYEIGIDYTRRLLALDPWREEGHRQLLRLYALNGQRNKAFAHYEEYRRMLVVELGVEPMSETTAVYDQLRADAYHQVAVCDHSVQILPFLGRETEHAWLVRQWKRAQHTANKCAFIAGMAGIGKTRLAEEVLAYAQSCGAAVLQGRCYAFHTPVAYHAIVEILRAAIKHVAVVLQQFPLAWQAELARLLPELRDGLPSDWCAPPHDESAYQRMFESVVQFLHLASETVSAQQNNAPLILFIDDLHWADDASIDLLRYLIYRLRDTPIWFLGTYRREFISSNIPLRQLCHDLSQESHASVLSLTPLTEEAVLRLVRIVPHIDYQAARYLYAVSEGNPFMLHYFLRDIVERQHGIGEQTTAHSVTYDQEDIDMEGIVAAIPVQVRELILAQMGYLSAAARQLLQLAATKGRCFTSAALAAELPNARRMRAGLRECLDRHVLVCQSPEKYAFTHHLIWRVIQQELPWAPLLATSEVWKRTTVAPLGERKTCYDCEIYDL